MERKKILHIRQHAASDWPALTLALERNAEGTYTVGYALCTPPDQFCRKVGRAIAEGRRTSPRAVRHRVRGRTGKELAFRFNQQLMMALPEGADSPTNIRQKFLIQEGARVLERVAELFEVR